jgi:DNA repair exonuclease SbcCD ATPase subunit
MTDMDRYTQELRDALAAKDARIAELEADWVRVSRIHAEVLAAREAELAEAQAHIDGLEGEPTKALAMKWKARAEQAEAELANLHVAARKLAASFNRVDITLAAREAELATVRAGAAQAEAELATVREEAEKWRSAASVLCGAHIGVPQATCPVCELATLRGALEAIRASVVVPLMTSEAKRLRNAVVNEIDAALTATPPHRTPEGER